MFCNLYPLCVYLCVVTARWTGVRLRACIMRAPCGTHVCEGEREADKYTAFRFGMQNKAAPKTNIRKNFKNAWLMHHALAFQLFCCCLLAHSIFEIFFVFIFLALLIVVSVVHTNTKDADTFLFSHFFDRGKFGTVYKCQEKSTGLHVAAKFIPTPKRDDRRNVEREVEIMNSLQHPLIIQLYDAFEYQKMMCVVLEL